MKKITALILCLVLALSLAACNSGGKDDSSANNSSTNSSSTNNGSSDTTNSDSGNGGSDDSSSELSVGLILPGVITDESWCYTAYQGIQELESDGYRTAYVENIDTSNCEAVAMNFVDEGYSLVIAHGSQFGDAMIRVAENFPDNYFFVYGKAPVDNYPDNIGFVDTAVFHATYVCGYLAAKMSQTGVVGYIGGSESAGQLTMKNAFAQGASDAVEGVKVLTIMTGSTDDTALGKESALSMIDQSADVIMHAADTTGLGVIEACVEQDVYVMGYGSDQHDLAPSLMLTSVIEIVPPVIASQVDRILDGSFGGVYKPGLGVGVELAEVNGDVVSSELAAEISQLIEDVANGNVNVIESYES